MSSPTTDPGLLGVVPFTFECHRCGHCCSGGSGFVWVEEEELGGLARAMEMEEGAFIERYVRSTPDPRTGALRLSLVACVDVANGQCFEGHPLSMRRRQELVKALPSLRPGPARVAPLLEARLHAETEVQCTHRASARAAT